MPFEEANLRDLISGILTSNMVHYSMENKSASIIMESSLVCPPPARLIQRQSVHDGLSDSDTYYSDLLSFFF